MPLPGQTVTIRDPGLGTVQPSNRNVLYLGCSSAGTVDTLYSFTNKSDVIDATAGVGQGPLAEDVCRALDIAGGPAYAMRLTGSTAGAAGAVTAAPTGSATGTITVAGAAYDSYEVQIEITATGTLATAKFRFSLDDGRSWSPDLLVPSGATYAIPDTGLTLTFVPGAGAVFFEDGDIHSFDCTAPLYSTANLATAFTAILAGSTQFRYVVLVGEHATASAAATMFAAFATHLTSMQTQFRYVGGAMDGGSRENDRAAAITGHAASESARINLCYGYSDIASSKPMMGWGSPRRSILTPYASRVASNKISTDPARVSSGALTGVLSIRDDEFRSPLLDAEKFVTLRTWQGRPGFYVTNGWMRAAPGSDFQYIQHRLCMDVACEVVVAQQADFVSKGFRTNPDGTINDGDAATAEAKVKAALKAELISPSNEEGTQGHVSNFGYSIDRTNNVLVSAALNTTTKIRPLAYPKTIATEIGFSSAV